MHLPGPIPLLLAILLILPSTALADPPPLHDAMRLEVRGSVTALSDDDLDATYGVLPAGELGVSWPLGRQTRVAVSIGYASSSGDPYYDTPGFDAGHPARLRVVPLTFALRLASSGERPVRIVGGLAFQVAWIDERVPTDETASGLHTLTGDGAGLLVTVGPEWRLGRGRHVLSLEFALGGPSGEVHESNRRHDVDLRGFHLRCGYALALGSGEVR